MAWGDPFRGPGRAPSGAPLTSAAFVHWTNGPRSPPCESRSTPGSPFETPARHFGCGGFFVLGKPGSNSSHSPPPGRGTNPGCVRPRGSRAHWGVGEYVVPKGQAFLWVGLQPNTATSRRTLTTLSSGPWCLNAVVGRFLHWKPLSPTTHSEYSDIRIQRPSVEYKASHVYKEVGR